MVSRIAYNGLVEIYRPPTRPIMDPATRARLYQAQYQSFEQDLPFWSALAAEGGGPILEMGCGTGRLVAALAGMGYPMIGLDHDAAMLERAEAALADDLHRKVTWIKGNLVTYQLNEPVQLAIGALNTFALLDDADFCAALRSARSNLTATGLIALDLPAFDPDPAPIGDDDPLDVFTDPETGASIELRALVDDQTSRGVNVTWLYDELLADGRVIRHPWEQVYFQRTVDQLRQLIQQSGLSVRSIYGDYDFSPLLPESGQLLMVLEHK
ncbi:MAG: class I SAM-dependent methyltransferase [Anaerolineales bacterium]|nr:MAG: class I SAM-dependent methyltransferase [Anaerolineales bacterium]